MGSELPQVEQAFAVRKGGVVMSQMVMGPMAVGPLGPRSGGTRGVVRAPRRRRSESRGSQAPADGGPATSVGRPGARRGALRVRWGRVVALVLAVLLAVTAGLAATGAVARSGSDRGDGAVVQRTTALQEHVVAPGDTLWSLAVAAAPEGDPREMVDRIMRLNGLSEGEIQVGEVVLVPNRR